MSDVLASAASAFMYRRKQNIDIKNGLILMATVIAFTLLDSYFVSLLPGKAVGSISVIFTTLLGLKFLIKPSMGSKKAAERKKNVKIPHNRLWGALIGLVCGFVGAGGGI